MQNMIRLLFKTMKISTHKIIFGHPVTLRLTRKLLMKVLHGNGTIISVFMQALKGFLKAQQCPGTKRTHYLL